MAELPGGGQSSLYEEKNIGGSASFWGGVGGSSPIWNAEL